MLWKRSCCVFCGCGSEVNGYYCWHCVRVSTGKRLIAVTSWVETGGKLLLFFRPLQSDHQLVDSVGRKTWVYVRVCICVNICVCVGVSPPVRLCTRMHAHACFCVSVWRVFASLSVCVYILLHPDQEVLHRGDSELEADKNKSGFLIFPASVLCMFVSIT